MAEPAHTHVWSPWFGTHERCWPCGASRPVAVNSYTRIDARPQPTERELAVHRAVERMKAQT